MVSSPLIYSSKISDPFKGDNLNNDITLSYLIKKQKEIELDTNYLKQNELLLKKEIIKSLVNSISKEIYNRHNN